MQQNLIIAKMGINFLYIGQATTLTGGIWIITLIELPCEPTIHTIKDKASMYAKMLEQHT
jgi:hypothetical protein